MGEIFIFETRAVGGSVTDHPVVYLCQKQSEFPVVLFSYLMRKNKVKNKQRRKCEKRFLVVRPLLECHAKSMCAIFTHIIKFLLGKAWPKYKKVLLNKPLTKYCIKNKVLKPFFFSF